MKRAKLDKRPADVARMFDDVAVRYDVTNSVLSLGQDRRWRKMVLEAVNPRPGDVVLDIAAGTGTSSELFDACGAHVVPADLSFGMLCQGKRRHPNLAFMASDAMRLPFANNAFDAVTMSFGLRNVQDPVTALREFHRVTKPGGMVVICEFSTPVNAAFRKVYSKYLVTALPTIARCIGSNVESYAYLAESIQAWPDQAGMASRLQTAGWRKVQWRDLTCGIVALHRGTKTA